MKKNSRFFVKYQWYLDIRQRPFDDGYPSALINEKSGSFYFESISPRQKFSGSSMLKACQPDILMNQRIGGKKKIHLREFIFMNAQLYVITQQNQAFKLKDSTGPFCVKVTDLEYRKILKQLNENNRHGRDSY